MALQLVVEKYIQVPIKNNALQIISFISNEDVGIEDLACSLEVYLLSTKIDHRLNGMKLLSDILHYWSSNFSAGEADTFSQFYKSRLKDRFILMEHVLSGLMYLMKIRTIGEDNVIRLNQEMFSELQIPALPQRARFYAHSIILQTLLLHRAAAVRLGGDLVYGFIQAIDGETDPRNLVIALQSVPLITKNLPITLLLEELFEVVSCYFPIDFESIPGVDITREELASALSTALSSTSLFSVSLLPLLIEKLTSEVFSAKKDSITLINEILPLYDGALLKGYTNAIWYGLKNLIFTGKFTGIEQEALKAVRQLVSALSDWNVQEAYQFVNGIIQNTKHHLLESDIKLLEPSIGILVSASCTAKTFLQIGRVVFPMLLENTKSDQKAVVINSLSRLISVLDNRGEISDLEINLVNLVKKGLFPSIIDFKIEQLGHDAAQYTFTLLNSMLCLPEFLSDDESLSIVNTYLDILLGYSEDQIPEVVQNGLLRCANFSRFISIQNQIILKARDLIMRQHEMGPVYRALTAICTDFNLAKEIIPICIQKAIVCDKMISFRLCVDFLLNVWEKSMRKFDGNFQELYSNSVLQPTFEFLTGVECSELILNFFRKVFVEFSSELKTRWIETLYQELMLYKPPFEISEIRKFSVISVVFSSSPLFLITLYISSLLDISFELIMLDSESYLSAAELFCSLVSNLPDSGILKVLRKFDFLFSSLLEQQIPRLLKCYGIILQGLLVRSHSDYFALSLKILSIFPSSILGDQAVESFSDLLIERDYLSRKTHSNINIFYKQHLFLSVIQHVLDRFRDSVGSIRQRYLHTIVTFIQILPIQVISADLSRLIDPLLACLDINNVHFSSKLVLSIFNLLIQSSDIVKSHFELFLPFLYSLTYYQQDLLVRLDALRILRAQAHKEVSNFRRDVLEVIQKSLTDKKRVVRREAVICATAWYMIMHVENS